MSLLYAVGLLVVFLLLLSLELFIPSGGLLGIAAAAALIGSVVLAFMHSLEAGAIVLVGSAFGVPIFISFGLRLWPKTAIGKRMLTFDPEADAVQEAALRVERDAMIGKVGIAKSNMLPSGMIELDGMTVDAISIGMAIDAGQAVEVVSVTSGRLRVRPIDSDRSPSSAPFMPTSLETPIESLGSGDQ